MSFDHIAVVGAGAWGTALANVIARAGRAVLLAYEYGEGNGSEESRANGIARATQLERPVVDAMGEL